MNARRFVIPTLVAFSLTASVSASEQRNARRAAEQATKALNDDEYQRALDGYREAEVMFPDSPELAYNQAIAHYRLRDFAKARECFSQALSTRDLTLEKKIKYNLGNCAYAEALERQTDLQAAIDSLRTAILHYRDALELGPNDRDARANIEMAQLLIKDLLDKLKQQQEKEKEKEKQDQEQQQQQSDNPASQPSEDQQQDQQQPQDGSQQQQQQEQQRSQADQKEERRAMSPEEAERLLQAVRDKERQRRTKQRQQIPVRRVPVDRDW